MGTDENANSAVERRTLDDLLREAETRIERYAPEAALKAITTGAVVVDIRSDTDRECDGMVPGSFASHAPCSYGVSIWTAPCETPTIRSLDDTVIPLCDHGCSTIIGAATLVELGYAGLAMSLGGVASRRSSNRPDAASRWRQAGRHDQSRSLERAASTQAAIDIALARRSSHPQI